MAETPENKSKSESNEAGNTPTQSVVRDPIGYWRTNLTVILSLLSIWAIVSYGCSILFIEQLNEITIGKIPLGFWFAQQGSIYVFVVLIFVYALLMDRFDKKYGVEE